MSKRLGIICAALDFMLSGFFLHNAVTEVRLDVICAGFCFICGIVKLLLPYSNADNDGLVMEKGKNQKKSMNWKKARERMKAKVKFAEEREIDIDKGEAFRLLCHVLDMPYVLAEDVKFEIRRCKKSTEGFSVFVQENDGHFMRYDDRARLFSALRNVAVNIFSNVYFRRDHYIDTRWDDEKS